MSIFGNLDGLYARKEINLEKFLVKHIREALFDKRCTDKTSLERLKSIEKALNEGSLATNITVLQGDSLMVIDGNKTAAAFHHIHQADQQIELSVFLIVPKVVVFEALRPPA